MQVDLSGQPAPRPALARPCSAPVLPTRPTVATQPYPTSCYGGAPSPERRPVTAKLTPSASSHALATASHQPSRPSHQPSRPASSHALATASHQPSRPATCHAAQGSSKSLSSALLRMELDRLVFHRGGGALTPAVAASAQPWRPKPKCTHQMARCTSGSALIY